MTFEELGSLLREEREKHGVSEEEMANRLKIHVRLIRALEKGDTASLPHAVYTRGFIRAYGSYFGMDAATVQEAVEAVPHAVAEDEMPALATHAEGPGAARRLLLPCLLAAVCLAGIGFWLYGNASRSAEDDNPVHATAQPSLPETLEAPPLRQTQEKQPLRQTQEKQPTPSTPPAPAAEEKDKAPAQSVDDKKTANANTLIITALSECWIHSNADNTDSRQFSLRKGDTFALTFSRKLVIKFGNAGGVRLRYNGEDLPAPGASGQVRTLTFPQVP